MRQLQGRPQGTPPLLCESNSSLLIVPRIASQRHSQLVACRHWVYPRSCSARLIFTTEHLSPLLPLHPLGLITTQRCRSFNDWTAAHTKVSSWRSWFACVIVNKSREQAVTKTENIRKRSDSVARNRQVLGRWLICLPCVWHLYSNIRRTHKKVVS